MQGRYGAIKSLCTNGNRIDNNLLVRVQIAQAGGRRGVGQGK